MATDANGWTPNDYAALVGMANRQGAPPDWFGAAMLAESGLSPAAINASGYRGLIQFSKSNLRGFGLTNRQIEDFIKLTPAQQMPYVERYLRPWRPADGWANRAQLHQAVYLPGTIKAFGSDPHAIIVRKGDPNYNAILDKAKKGYIQVIDLEAFMRDAINHSPNKWQTFTTGIENAGGEMDNPDVSNVLFHPGDEQSIADSAGSAILVAVSSLVIGASAYYIYNQNKQKISRLVQSRPTMRR